jgi:hypothetical protein
VELEELAEFEGLAKLPVEEERVGRPFPGIVNGVVLAVAAVNPVCGKLVVSPPDPSVVAVPPEAVGSTTALVATPLLTGMVVASAEKSRMLLVVESKLVWPRAMRLFLRS